MIMRIIIHNKSPGLSAVGGTWTKIVHVDAKCMMTMTVPWFTMAHFQVFSLLFEMNIRKQGKQGVKLHEHPNNWREDEANRFGGLASFQGNTDSALPLSSAEYRCCTVHNMCRNVTHCCLKFFMNGIHAGLFASVEAVLDKTPSLMARETVTTVGPALAFFT